MTNSDTSQQESIDKRCCWVINQLCDRKRIRLKQILAGFQIGDGDDVECTVCNHEIPQGSHITIYAYRKHGNNRWIVPRIYCDNNKATIVGTLGFWDAIAAGRVGTISDVEAQSHVAVLIEPEIRALWSPIEGSRIRNQMVETEQTDAFSQNCEEDLL